MKMLAGLKLNSRKPSTAPPRLALSSITRAVVVDRPTTKLVTQAKNTTPPARPSSPSMRLIALMIATIQSTVTATANTPMSRWPMNGSAMASMR